MLHELDTFVMARNRICRGALCAGKIVWRMHAAPFTQGADHIIGHFASIKRVTPVLGHAAQNLCLARGAEDIADPIGLAALAEMCDAVTTQALKITRPVVGHARCHGNTFLGVVNAGRQQSVNAKLSVAFAQPTKRIDCAWYGHGFRCVNGDADMSGRSDRVRADRSRRAA